MTDVFLFMRHGWKSIWKQKTIWLFSALSILSQLFYVFQVKRPTSFFPSLILLLTSLFFIVLSFISYIGVPYLAYCFLIGKSTSIQETMSAVKKFSGRVIGCSCLGFLAISPFLLFWALAVSINSSTHTLQLTNKTILVFLPISIFYAMPQFTIVAFFENDWGIRQSIDKAWNLFRSHFVVLATLGLIVIIIFRVYSVTSVILTMLIHKVDKSL